MLQNAVLLRKSEPWSPNMFHGDVFCTAPATRNVCLQTLFERHMLAIACETGSKTHTFGSLLTRNKIHCVCHTRRPLNVQNWSEHVSSGALPISLRNVLRDTVACTCSTSRRSKVLREEVLCEFWLPNLLRATMACNFWSLIRPDGSASAASFRPKSLEKPNVSRLFYPFACSSFYWLSLLTLSLLWLFSPLLLRLSISRKFDYWKNLMFRDFSTFLRTLLFFLLTFSSDSFSSVTLLTTFAASVHKSEVWLLKF